MSVIPVLGRLKQRTCEFQNVLDYIARPCLINWKRRKRNKEKYLKPPKSSHPELTNFPRGCKERSRGPDWDGQAWVHMLVCSLLLVRLWVSASESWWCLCFLYVRLFGQRGQHMARASALALLPVFAHRPPFHARDGMIYQTGRQNSHLWNIKNKALALLSLWDGKTAVRRDHKGFAAVMWVPDWRQ